MGKFDQLVTIAQWTQALDALLERANAAATSGGAVAGIQEDLFAFVKESPGKCDFLDVIAAAAANDLFDREASRLIASIASRKRELQIATKTLNSVTTDLGKTESQLKFEKIIQTLQVSADLIQELKDVRKDLTEEQKSILDRALAIADSVDDIQELLRECQVTDQAVQALGSSGTDAATIKKLRTLVGRKIRGEIRFLEFVKAELGCSDTVLAAMKETLLEHAGVQPG